MRRRKLITLTIALLGAVLLSSSAFAGEAKKQPPLTYRAGAITSTTIAGEAKNELPFTRAAVRRTVSSPDSFERYAAAHPYGRGLTTPTIARTSTGFRWRDAAIGGAATAAALALLGSAVGVRARRRGPVGRPASA